MTIPKAALPFLEAPRRPLAGPATRLAAAGLIAASALLSRIGRRLLDTADAVPAPLPRLEFHADADTPDGALYLDGLRICHLPGVRRL